MKLYREEEAPQTDGEIIIWDSEAIEEYREKSKKCVYREDGLEKGWEELKQEVISSLSRKKMREKTEGIGQSVRDRKENARDCLKSGR